MKMKMSLLLFSSQVSTKTIDNTPKDQISPGAGNVKYNFLAERESFRP